MCPIRALGDFLALLGSSEGPLFTFSNGRPLTWQQLSSTVQSILHAAGYTGSYSGHSICIGEATTAAAWGVPDHLIKTPGRWSSDAYQIYIRTPGCIAGTSTTFRAAVDLAPRLSCLRFGPSGLGLYGPEPPCYGFPTRRSLRLGAGGLVAGLRVGRPVGVLPPWGVLRLQPPGP